MAGVLYHWKHGWIPLDHYAALSKAHGSHAGAARIMHNLYPVHQGHLSRSPHLIVGHEGTTAHFTVHDPKSGRSTRLPEAEAHGHHTSGRTITGVDERGKVTTTVGNDLGAADDDALTTELGDLAAAGDYGPRFEQLAGELDRRDQQRTGAVWTPAPAEPDPKAEQEALNRLLFGDLFVDDPDAWRAQQTAKRRKRDPEKELRSDYDAWLHTQWLRAEEETRGAMLTKRAQRDHVDVTRLFNRDLKSLSLYATAELQEWFAQPGNGRMSFPEFRAGARDDKRARKAAQRHHGFESEYG